MLGVFAVCPRKLYSWNTLLDRGVTNTLWKMWFCLLFLSLLDPARVHISPGVPWILSSSPVIFRFSWSHRWAQILILLEGQVSCFICDREPTPNATCVGSQVTIMTFTSKSTSCPLELRLPLFLQTTKLCYHDRLLPFP